MIMITKSSVILPSFQMMENACGAVWKPHDDGIDLSIILAIRGRQFLCLKLEPFSLNNPTMHALENEARSRLGNGGRQTTVDPPMVTGKQITVNCRNEYKTIIECGLSTCDIKCSVAPNLNRYMLAVAQNTDFLC
jgi:hypothetical protein